MKNSTERSTHRRPDFTPGRAGWLPKHSFQLRHHYDPSNPSLAFAGQATDDIIRAGTGLTPTRIGTWKIVNWGLSGSTSSIRLLGKSSIFLSWISPEDERRTGYLDITEMNPKTIKMSIWFRCGVPPGQRKKAVNPGYEQLESILS